MTLSECAYNLLNLLRGGRSTNSEPLSIEQLKFNVLYYRALILRRDAERGVNLSSVEQVIPVGIQLIDPQFPAPSGSVFTSNWFDAASDGIPIKLAVSDETVPSPLRLSSREAVSYVGGEHYGGAYAFVNPHQARALIYSRFTGSYKRAFLDGGRLFLMNPTFETGEAEVTVRAAFENPKAAHDFSVDERHRLAGTTPEESEYFDDDRTELPLPMDLYQRIVQSLLSGELRLLTRTEPDESLNEQP